jgi:hypothetical protein
MECELWPRLYALVIEIGKTRRRTGVRYSDILIVLVFFWACLHDRPQVWACQVRNWRSTTLRPLRIPSSSTISRRLRSLSIQSFLEALEERVRNDASPEWVKFIDGKPLPVSSCSKDPDARVGRVVKGFAKGYKLHAIWGHRALPDVWTIRPLNENESPIARQLIPHIRGTGYLLGDAQYDVNVLHDLAIAHGHQLVAPRNQRKAQHPKSMSDNAHRRHAIEMLERPFGQALIKQRNDIERAFGTATCFGGGLAPLPAWVRRLHRVHRWVCAKLVLNALRIQQRLTA